MSFAKLTISNFQSHRNSTVEFHPGVNIIAGETSAGKSTIIRALGWILQNKPAGDGIRAHGLKPKDKVTATLEFQTPAGTWHEVTRTKNSTENAYIMGDEVFKALRSDVPEEISSLANINEVNFQGQFDGPFLLSKSPGEVSRFLNRMVELDAIDAATKKANSFVAQAKEWEKTAQVRVESLETELGDTEWLDRAEVLADALEDADRSIKETDRKIDSLNSLIRRIDTLTVPDSYWLPSGLDKDVDDLENLYREGVEVIDNRGKKLRKLIADMDDLHNSLDRMAKAIEQKEKDLSELEYVAKICPTCGRPL